MGRQHQEQNALRRYLLKQLSAPEQEEIELRLLSEDSFFDELDIEEDELIDEYLANELSPDERERFEQHFLTTPERNSKLHSGGAMKRYFGSITPNPQSPPSAFKRLQQWLSQLFPSQLSILPSPDSTAILSPTSIGVMFLLVAVTGLIVWRGVFYQSDLDKGLLALNEAYRQERPIEARVSTLDYAPFVSTRDGERKPVNDLELDRAQRFLLDAEKANGDAASYHALGKLYLLQRENDRAIEYLDKAAKADTSNAQIYADLGAAYLEKGRRELDLSKSSGDGAGTGKGLEDLGRSIEYLKQALELDPSLLEALFNRALVHQYQGLNQEAAADWRAYLEKDPSSQWATDARRHLKRLEDKKPPTSQSNAERLEGFLRAYRARDDTSAWEIYRRSHVSGGNLITKVLVDDFLSDNSGGKANENLLALNYLGSLETSKVEDTFTSDLAKVYASATPQTQLLLREARKQVEKGYELLGQSQIEDATGLFVNARNTFEKADDVPELLAVDVAIAQGAVLQPDLAKAQEVLERIIPTCESKRYRWLLAQALIKRAHLQSNLDNYSEAISDSSQALQLFQELKALANTLENFIQLSSLHLHLSDNETSFSFLTRATAMAQEEDAAPTSLWSIYIAVSLNLNSLKLYRAALDYQHEALQLALLLRIPLLISRSYQNIGLTYGYLRQFDRAIENVRNAYEQGRPLAAHRNGQNMMANASLRLGDVYRVSGDETRALAAYEESSRLYEGLNFAHYGYATHKGKFLTYLAQNNDGMASQELLTVLDLFDKYREKIREDRQSSRFFDKEQDVYDLAINFAYFRLGDQRRAFEYSEICRARNLRALMQHGAQVTQGAGGLNLRPSKTSTAETASPLTLTEIQQQLPEHVQIVQFAVLEKKLLIWCITRSDIFTTTVEVESSRLEETVETALRQIRQQDENGAADNLKNLYNLLIEPIRERLNSKMVLCFVPDKALHHLPFGALVQMSSGRHLAQDYQVMISPSSSIFVESTIKARAQASDQQERLLGVGNPTFDRSANPTLSDLPGAEREVTEIAQNYQPRLRRLLIGPEATRKSVKEGLAQAHVVHFAAHYQIDARSTLSSKLVLSPEFGEQAKAQLDSGDIYQMNLAHTRLVVLAACQTGIEQQLRGEGPIGFARSFLVAGVPVVVASLWPVDSDATSELMILFHRYRTRDRLSTTDALTRAQQEMMSQDNYSNPYYWAGFTALGGYSEF